MSSKPGKGKQPSSSRPAPLAAAASFWTILTSADKLLILSAVIFIIGFSAFQFDPSPHRAEVVVESATGVFGPYPISQSRVLRFEGPMGVSEVEIETGAARIVTAPCANQLCVRRGWVRRRGDAAICVPNRLILRVRSRDNGKGFDMVSR